MQIRLTDIERHAHLSGDGFGATLPSERVVLSGGRDMAALPSGLVVHTLDAQAAADFETRVIRAPNFLLHIVLAGPVHATLGGRDMGLGRAPGAPVRVCFSATGAPAEFHRRALRGEQLCKVNIRADWDWLEARGVTRDEVLAGATARTGGWTATVEEVAAAERLLTTPPPLEREALATGLLARALGRLTGAAGEGGLRTAEREKLVRMEAFAAAPGPLPSLEEIARAGGISVSSMRRLFQRAHGLSVLSRVRALRFARAAEALRAGASVAQAAHDSGYVSPEAFATAFRRATGQCPSTLRAQPN
ncbi:helix-turn-helix transcriptional regulator [Pseudooceanicola sp. LIPI14-2-Ac024]|uniref:helix-turn-helix transcriptional regulator n=1 Tax=Pseudooceanicola sp. LIPI14-2-Ac024 TaxID=3344875 RepID=UPI0035D10060